MTDPAVQKIVIKTTQYAPEPINVTISTYGTGFGFNLTREGAENLVASLSAYLKEN